MTRDRISALMFLAFSLGYGVLAWQIKLFPGSEYQAFTARTLPIGLAIAGSVVAFSLLFFSGDGLDEGKSQPRLHWRKIIILCVFMLVYGWSIPVLGFVISSTLFLMAGMLILGERRWNVIAGLVLPMVVFFWLVLSKLLGIYLEPGIIFLGG